MLNYQRVSSMTDDLWIFIALMALDHLWLIMASPAIFCGCINFPLPGKVREIPAKTVWNLGCFRWAHVLNPGTKTSRNHAKLQRKTIPHAHPFTCSHPISPKFWSGRISKDQLDPQRGKFWGRPSLGALSVAEEILSTPISWMKWQQRRCLGPPYRQLQHSWKSDRKSKCYVEVTTSYCFSSSWVTDVPKRDGKEDVGAHLNDQISPESL